MILSSPYWVNAGDHYLNFKACLNINFVVVSTRSSKETFFFIPFFLFFCEKLCIRPVFPKFWLNLVSKNPIILLETETLYLRRVTLGKKLASVVPNFFIWTLWGKKNFCKKLLELFTQNKQITNNIPNWRRSGIFIVNFEHISHLVLVFQLLTLSR